MVMGGNRYALGYKHTEETRKRISAAMHGNRHRLGKNRKIERQCPVCKHVYVCTPRDKRKRCSRRCFKLAHSRRMSGSNNPSFIDGRSRNKRCWRGSFWNRLRKVIYRRDGWHCQLCGVHCQAQQIQCHHIIPWRRGGTNGPGNLITVCSSCHGRLTAAENRGRARP